MKVHRQAAEGDWPQECVEVMLTLKRRPPPYLDASKHPGGEFHHLSVTAVVSDHPTCSAAASQAARSVIHPKPS